MSIRRLFKEVSMPVRQEFHATATGESKEAVQTHAAIPATRPFNPIINPEDAAIIFAAFFADNLAIDSYIQNYISLPTSPTLSLTLPDDSERLPTVAAAIAKRKADVLAIGDGLRVKRQNSTADCLKTLNIQDAPTTTATPPPSPPMIETHIVIPDPYANADDHFLETLYFTNNSLPGKCFGVKDEGNTRILDRGFNPDDATNFSSHRF